MKIRNLILGAVLLAVSATVVAQSNPGVDYYLLGEYDLVKSYFTKNMSQNPADAYYYLGEVAYKEGNLAEAKKNYESSLAANPESKAVIGMAKLNLKSNPAEATKALNDYQKKNKKDISVILAIADAFYDNGMAELGAKKVAEAKKADKKSPYIFIFEGDQLDKAGKMGDAATQYDQAILFDQSCLVAYVKFALVYANNTGDATLPVERLNKVIQIDPNYTVAYKYLGKVYTRTGFYLKAVDAFKTYFDAGNHTIEDITLYASANYFAQQYDEALRLINMGLNINPNHFVLNRLKMYTYHDTKAYADAAAAGDRFFALPRTDKDKYLAQDHEYFATALFAMNRTKEAESELQKALALQDNDKDVAKKYAATCASNSDYPGAIKFYNSYLAAMGDDADFVDKFYSGRYYYMAGTQIAKDSLPDVKARSQRYLAEADSVFATIVERFPDNYMGYFWRARTNSSLDPETTQGLAQPYYEKTVEVILANDPTKTAELLEAYSYLGYFHYLQYYAHKKADDKTKVKFYSEKILELDPENKTGKAFYDFASQP